MTSVKWKFVDGKYVKIGEDPPAAAGSPPTDAVQPTPAPAARRRGRPKKERPPEPDRICRTCKFIWYGGVKKITFESGICWGRRDEGVPDCYVRSDSCGCEKWVKRSRRQLKKDNDYLNEMTVFVKTFRFQDGKRRR